MSAKRYTPCLHDHEAVMEESPHGGYVCGIDYERLLAEQQADERELSAMQFVVERALNYCERQALGRDPKPGDLTLTELERLCRHALNKPTEGLDHD